MPLETGTYISDLNQNNPVGATDGKQRGDDHIRLVKKTILNTFPSVTGAVTLTHTQINAAAIKSEENTFTLAATGTTYPIELSSVTPLMMIHESDASANEGYWDIGAASELFMIRARDDAFATADYVLYATRVGATVTSVRIGDAFEVDDANTRVELNTGLALRIYDASNADAIQLSHNGTNAILEDISGTTALNIDNMNVYVRNGSTFRVYDSTNADYLDIAHGGTNLDLTIQGTTNVALKGGSAGGYFQLETGMKFRAFDTSNLDYVALVETGTQAQLISNANAIHLYPSLTEVARISSTLFDMRGGTNFRIRDPGNTDYIDLDHNGTDLTVTAQSTAWWRFSGFTSGVLVLDGASTRHYDTTNADYLELQHDGTNGRILTNAGTIRIDDPVSSPNVDAAEVGYKGAPVNVQNANYTLALDDASKTVRKESGGAGETYTIPANASVAFPIGTIIEIQNDGGGDLSIAITTDTLEEWGTGNTGTRTLPDNNKAIIEKSTATLWKYSATG